MDSVLAHCNTKENVPVATRAVCILLPATCMSAIHGKHIVGLPLQLLLEEQQYLETVVADDIN